MNKPKADRARRNLRAGKFQEAAGHFHGHGRQDADQDERQETNPSGRLRQIQLPDKIDPVFALSVTFEKTLSPDPEMERTVEEQKSERRRKGPRESDDHGSDGGK